MLVYFVYTYLFGMGEMIIEYHFLFWENLSSNWFLSHFVIFKELRKIKKHLFELQNIFHTLSILIKCV